MNYWRIINRTVYFIVIQIMLLAVLHGVIAVSSLSEDPCYYVFLLFGSLVSYALFFFCRKKRIRDKKPVQEQTDRIDALFEDVRKHYSFQQKLLENMFTMVDSMEGISMWIKDDNDKYLFADKTLRRKLLDDLPMKQIIGKTDGEISHSVEANYSALEEVVRSLDISNFSELPAEYFMNGKVCNITDVITRTLRRPCRFYEVIGEFSFDVWKTPVINSEGVLQGTVGCLVDVSDKKESWEKGLEKAKEKGLVFQIDATAHYIFKEYGFCSDHLVMAGCEEGV